MPKNERVLSDEEKAAKEKRRKKNRIFNICLYCVAGALILTGIFIILRDQTTLFTKNTADKPKETFPPVTITDAPTPSPTADPRTPDPSATPTPEPTPTPTPEPASPPVSVHFVDHDIDVEVIPVGYTADGGMATVPSAVIAGWFEYGAAPNQDGNCIIAGHNRYKGQKGLFSILHDGLAIGDRITVVTEDGRELHYVVETIDNYRYDQFPEDVMAPSSDRRLTLITCLGDYDHDLHMSLTRVVAICRPVD
jgi:hypothetical protein